MAAEHSNSSPRVQPVDPQSTISTSPKRADEPAAVAGRAVILPTPSLHPCQQQQQQPVFGEPAFTSAPFESSLGRVFESMARNEGLPILNSFSAYRDSNLLQSGSLAPLSLSVMGTVSTTPMSGSVSTTSAPGSSCFTLASPSAELSGPSFQGFAQFSSMKEAPIETEPESDPVLSGTRAPSVPPAPVGELAGFTEDSTQETLKSLNPNKLSSNQALFYFGVLATRANLMPRFRFGYGDKNKNKLRVCLTLYGHTAVLGPDFDSVPEAKAAACRSALKALCDSNPTWPIPEEPIHGTTDAKWSWIRLLEAYCIQNNLPGPEYAPRKVLERFVCELWVNDQMFSTWQLCSSLEEAKHTAAHVALYQLLVSPNPRAEKISSGIEYAATLLSGADVQSPPMPNGGKARQRSGGAGPVITDRKKAEFLSCLIPAPAGVTKTPSSRRRGKSKAKSCESPVKPSLKNANYEPLVNSRLARLQEPVEDKADPLVDLREIQNAVQGLGRNASFSVTLEKICQALKINPPTFQIMPSSGEIRFYETRFYPYVAIAIFDNSHPYLQRASPIKLAWISIMGEKAFEITAIYAIQLLLKIVKEDVDVEGASGYKTELPVLADFEVKLSFGLRDTQESIPFDSFPVITSSG